MTPYKGIIRITCTEKKCSPVTRRVALAAGGVNPPLRRVGFTPTALTPTALTQPAAECINCDRARLEIIDLDGKVVAEGPERSRRAESREQGADSKEPKARGTKTKVTKRAEAEPTV